MEVDAVGDAETLRERRQRGALGPVADDLVAQRRMLGAQPRERLDDVGVPLARDEVADGDERRRAGVPVLGARAAGRSVPRWTTSTASAAAQAARQRTAVPALLASTTRACANVRATVRRA